MNEEGALFAVNMLILTPCGNVYTAYEHTSWLEEADFADVGVVSIPGLVSRLVLARNPG